jgi:exo-beta-1,3-glucanase (GH17 family)
MLTNARRMTPRITTIEDAPRVSRGAFLVCAAGALLVATLAGCAGTAKPAPPAAPPAAPASFVREEPFVVRPLRLTDGGRWIGNAIAYGPHRDGQRPGGASPSRRELREDLDLMAKHWSLLRVYQAQGPAESLLAIIDAERRPMKVMLGLWIDPADSAANQREIDAAVRLARQYPAIVLAVCVGNETQVSWSGHRSPPATLIAALRQVRARTSVPVTTADDFNFWNKPEARDVAREVDFVVTHMHPLWNGIQVEDALAWTQRTLASIVAAHPDRPVVLGEVGWATQRHTEGEQATLMKGVSDEAAQKTFFTALTAWVERERVPTFFFEAFDENWKGGAHPDEVEKHWGLYRADRTPKPAIGGAPRP